MSQEHATYTQRIEQKTKNKIFYFPEIQNFVSRKKFDASAHSNSNKEHDMWEIYQVWIKVLNLGNSLISN